MTRWTVEERQQKNNLEIIQWCVLFYLKNTNPNSNAKILIRHSSPLSICLSSLHADDDLDEFIRQVANLNSHGISPLHNATAADMNWSFGQSLFFASTVITTIGYGHVTPLTAAGKMFCIAYACVGIPLTLVLLSAAVERALVPVGWLLGRMQARVGHLYPPFNVRVMHLVLIGKPVAPLVVAAVVWLMRRTAASGGVVVNTSVNVMGLSATM